MRSYLYPGTDATLISRRSVGRMIQILTYRRCLSLAILLFAVPVFAAPIAVDDLVAVPANTPVLANDVSFNDTSIATDTYSIITPPSHGTATLTPNGLLDYTPNIGFASTDTLTYSIDDGAGGIATAIVTFDVVLTSDFLTPASNFIVGLEDIPTPLNLTADPSLESGGTLQDITGVDALYRAETQIGVPITSTIPTGSTGINITGYATRNVGTSANDRYNDDYELISINVNLREGTYSGRVTYSTAPSTSANTGVIDQYTFIDVPLGQSILTDTSLVSGNWTGDSDPLVEIDAGQIRITETIPLQIAYHVEYLTSDGNSADFVSASGAVQTPNNTQSTFTIPLDLTPNDGSQKGYLVITGNSAANGANFAEEHKGFSRMVVDLEGGTVSGVIASERGELDSLTTTWSFKDYALIDLRNTPTASPVSITASSANLMGDSTASSTDVEDDPTVYIDATGDLIIERAAAHAAAFTTMYTSENYKRTGLSSIASFVGVESDTTLFDSNPPDSVDENGKPVNLQTFPLPASSSIGLVQMSWQTIGGNSTNENVGYGFAVIDLNNNTSSGSITFSRTTTPDLVAWQGVPIGTTMYGATAGGIALYQSNKSPGAFTDDYGETARFSIVNNADGSRVLEFTATSNAGTGRFADYIGTTQVSWLGSEPFSVQGVPSNGTLSHGSPTTSGGWEVDFSEISQLSISTSEHGSGILELNMVLASTGELDTIIVHVQPVVDDPILTTPDVVGYTGTPVLLGINVADSADVDGSETQLQTLSLSGVPTTVTLAASAGTVTNFGGGNWQVDQEALATLTATGPITPTTPVTVSGTNTDTDDIDQDSVIEDGNNGAGVDELDTVDYQETFNLTIRSIPTVNTQSTNTGIPTISGTANVGSGETLTVSVNGVTYTAGDGNLTDNGDGTWDLTIPASDTISDGTYAVSASLNHTDGGSGADITTDELIIDSTPPLIPTVNPLVTSDPTPVLTGTATVGANEVLTVTVSGTSYTVGDGNLVDNGDGTWMLSISNPLTEGDFEVTAEVSDSAGNVSVDASSSELTVEATPLSTPTVVSQITSNITPVVTGTAIVGAGNALTVTVDGATYTAGDGNLVHNSSGAWTLSIPSPLADNTYEVIAVVTDIFGNPYPDTSSDELVVDTIAPVIPTVVAQTTNNTTPTISGTATIALGETLTVAVDGTIYTAGDGNLVDNGDGTWDLSTQTSMPTGTYSVAATITDQAGNATSDSTSDELIIDTSPPAIPTVSSQTTNSPTPVISGTATIATDETLTVSVGGVTYTAGDGALVVNADGTWELSIPSALADGNYSVTATVIDPAGNASVDTTALELTIDTVQPVTPTVATQYTNSTSPVITGTATVTAGDILTVLVDGTTYTAGDGLLVDNGDGTWALSIAVALAENTYDVTTTVTDSAGNSTSDTTVGELTIDLTAPIAPGVTSLATTDPTPSIEGTATVAAGETLTVEINGIIYTAGDGNLTDNGDGTWALTIPATNILPEALYQVIATVTDAAGNSSIDPGIDDLLVDFTAPLTPGVTSLTTNDTTPLIEGTATLSPGEILTVTVNGIPYTAGDGNLVDNADGTWALSLPAVTPEGLYDVTATVTDIPGNTSTDPSASELLIDTTPPLVPSVVPQFTTNTTPVITGTANAGPGEILSVEVNGVTYTTADTNLVDNFDGTWALNILTPMLEGTYEVLATVTDAAGNPSSDTTSDELVIDITPPIAPTVNTLITNTYTPVLTGTTSAPPGETLTVNVNGVTYPEGDGNLIVNADNTWDLTIPPGSPIAEGNYEVVAIITDITGNTSTDASTLELTIDTDPPVIPTVTAQNTSNTTPTISGAATVAVNETLTVTVNGTTYTAGDGNLANNGDGTWDLTLPVSLVESTYPITVAVTDLAGNVSRDITTAELTIDTSAPLVPTVVSQITSNTTPVIIGTAISGTGEALTVTINGVTYTTAGGDLIDNGNGTWSLSIPNPLADNSYEVVATVTDTAGNASADITALELTIDTTPPVTPTVVSLITNNPAPTLEGTAIVSAGETLTVTVDNLTYSAGDGNLVDHGDDTWTLTIPTPLTDGTYEVGVSVSDAAGNTSSDSTIDELIIDTAPPVIPTVTALSTNIVSPTIEGTATVMAGDTLTVTVDGNTYTAGDGNLSDNSDGTWTLAIPATLSENVYAVTASVIDAAGNTGTDTTVGELNIDLTPPMAPGVTSLSTTDTTPVVSGTAVLSSTETLTVEVNGVTYTAGDSNLINNADGTWTLTIPTTNVLAENVYQVIATVTDNAGNSVSDTGIDDLLIDLTAPIAPGVTSLTTNNPTPTIEGTAILATGETLSVTVNSVTYTAGDGNLTDNANGTWSLAIPSITPDGTYDVTATITDIAGNVSIDPSSSELLIDTVLPAVPTVISQITNNTTPTIAGTATVAPGEVLAVSLDGTTYTAGDGNLIDNTDGTWTLTVPATLAELTYSVVASITDAAGNVSADTSNNELTIDLTAPVAPTVNTLISNTGTPVLSGTTSTTPGETLAVSVNGTTYSAGDGSLVVNSDGTWNLTIPVANAMIDGNYEVIASTTDLAGNTTIDSSTLELVIDTTAPPVPTVTAQTTSNTTPVLSGTATVAAGDTLTVIVGGATYTAGDGSLVDNGDGTWALTIPTPITDNTYPVTVTVTDAAGNSTDDTTTTELTIDTLPPVTPTVTSLITNNTIPVLSGTATVAAGETLTVTVDGSTYTAGDGFLIDNGDETWSLTIPVSLAESVFEVTATVTDAAGNSTSDVTTTELTIDLTAPTAPGVSSLATTSPNPVIDGTAMVAPGEILTLEVNGLTYNAGDGNLVDNGDGTWALTIPAANALTENLYQVVAMVTDAAGNSASDPGVDDLLVDFTAPVTPGVTSLTTNNTTPTLEGTAIVGTGETLTVEVTGVTYTAGDGNLVDNADGTWSLAIPTSLNEALYDVTATITDIAGNVSSDPSSGELLIDTTLPITPTVVPQITSNTSPIIEGTATAGAGEIVSVTVAGVTYTAGDGSLTDNTDGTWTLTVPVTLAELTYSVVTTVTDAAGNVSYDTSNNELIIDVTAPIAPTVNSLISSTNTPILTGTTSVTPGETLTVSVNGITYSAGDGNLVVNSNGTWDLTIPAANALTDGTYDVIATIADLAGNTTTDSTALELVVDTTAPAVPTVITQTTSNTTPVISGTAVVAAGETLTVTVDGVTYTAGDGNLADNGDGTWDLTIPTPITDNTYPVTVSVTDVAGNSAVDTSTTELTIDTTAPVTPTVTTLITNNTTPVISGTATVAAGETLTVTVDGSIYSAGDGFLVVNNNGTWALTIPLSLAESVFDVTASVSDAAGNTSSDATAAELTIDLTPPAAPGVTSLATTLPNPVVDGTAIVAPGEVLTASVDGVTYTAGDGNLVNNGDGTWSLTIPAANALTENLYQVVAMVTDAAGNSATDPGVDDLLVDFTAPVTPGVTSLTTNNTTPTIEGTAIVALGEILTVEVNGVIYTAGDGNLVDNTDGTWALALPIPLNEALYNVTATITDIAGNVSSDPSSGELLIDTTPPITPTVVAQITSNTSPTIEGTANAGAGESLTVTVAGTTYTAGDGNLVDNTNGTWTLAIASALAELTYSVTVTVTDAAGNVSADTSNNELVIDITAPIAPTVNAVIANNGTPVLSGTTSTTPGETLTVNVNGITYTVGDGNLIVNDDGTWELIIPASNAMPDGSYDVVATITDLAGNTTDDNSALELTIDTTAPIIPTVTAQTTNNTTPVISGTATIAAGDTLTVTVDGTTYTAGDGNLVDNGDGTWDLTVPTPLTDNTFPITVTVTDAAGNSTEDTTSTELTIDTIAPVIPTVTALITNNTSPVIEGTATIAPGETLSVTVDGSTYAAGDGFLVDNGDGTWALTLPFVLAEGIFDVTATVTDAAGNSTSDVTTDELTIDLTAPAAPGVTSLASTSPTPVIAGTATVAPGEGLTVEVDSVTYIAGDGNLVNNGDGTWSLTIPAAYALTENLYQVIATVTDAAGNSTGDPGIDDLLVDFTAPVTPGVTSLTSNNTTPTIEGTAIVATGEILSVTVNGITYTAGDGNLSENGDGTWALVIPTPLSEALYSVTASIADTAGNLSTDPSSSELLIDTTPPITPTVAPQITSNTSPTIAGTANAGVGETLTVTVDGITYTAGDSNLVDNTDGTWILSIPLSMPEGTYTVIATVTDAAGNLSTDASNNELVIDITAPIAPTVNAVIANNGTPILSGATSTIPGETLSVTINGITYTPADSHLVVNPDGTWELTIPAADGLADGSYEVVATITDLAGNTTTDNSALELVVDTTAPVSPTVTAQTTSNTTPVISGTATVAAGETLMVTIDGVSYTAGDGNLVDNGDGTWALTPTAPLADGIYDVVTTITDQAGNISRDSNAGELVIDTIAPATPSADSLTTTDSAPTLTGTATAGPNDTISVTIDGITYTAGDGNLFVNGDGTWSLNLPVTLSEGIYAIQVAVTDQAGNTAVSAPAQLSILPVIQPALIEPVLIQPALADFDNDGVPDALDLDDDNDGIPDTAEGTLDSDQDGQPDYQDLDSDNDGIADIIEVFGSDTDNDYTVDNFIDTDNNGLSDDLQLFPFELVDTDKDRVADFRDLDSDNDGLSDLLESGGADTDHNGRMDNFTDTNHDGADDPNQINGPAGRDTDNDGIVNRLDLDTDNDDIYDVVEAGATDVDNNGVLDLMQDTDRDGIPDSVDVNITAGADIDNDGIDDRFDASILNLADTDADGIADSFDPDINGDGFAEAIANNLILGQALPDTNGNGVEDVLEPNNGKIRTGLQGNGGCSTGDYSSGDGLVDPMFVLLLAGGIGGLLRRSRSRLDC